MFSCYVFMLRFHVMFSCYVFMLCNMYMYTHIFIYKNGKIVFNTTFFVAPQIAGMDIIESLVLRCCNVKSKAKIMFLIGIDCTIRLDQIIDSFLRWIGCVHKLALSLQTKEINQRGDEKFKDLLANIDAKLCAVVCKADFIQSGDLGTMKAFKSLQGSLRSICLNYGAGLMYTSASGDLNCTKLQKYILHSLYEDDIKVSLNVEIEEGIGTAFVPSQLDSPERILASTGIKFADV